MSHPVNWFLRGNALLKATDFSSAQLVWKGWVHFTLLDASSINYQYNYLCLIKMLCYDSRGLAFGNVPLSRRYYRGILQRKINVSLYWLSLYLCTNRLKVRLLKGAQWRARGKQRVCLFRGGQMAYPTSVRLVWEHTIIREGSFFSRTCSFWQQTFSCDQWAWKKKKKKEKAFQYDRFQPYFIFAAAFLSGVKKKRLRW